ncbi:hypothetical protein [Intrasporangium sp.]|uniref:hypothetical protein n=1 Tax=Intrasporangium sp. TaxID=1925024 RepID=UPI0032216148
MATLAVRRILEAIRFVGRDGKTVNALRDALSVFWVSRRTGGFVVEVESTGRGTSPVRAVRETP